jgi:hypothetical protein
VRRESYFVSERLPNASTKLAHARDRRETLAVGMMRESRIIDWTELQRQIRAAAAEAAERAADARRRRDAAGARLAELRRGRRAGASEPLVTEAALGAANARRAAEIARERVLLGLERSALAHDHSAEAHDRAAGLASRRGSPDRGGWHERAASQARHDADADRARAEELRQAPL